MTFEVNTQPVNLPGQPGLQSNPAIPPEMQGEFSAVMNSVGGSMNPMLGQSTLPALAQQLSPQQMMQMFALMQAMAGSGQSPFSGGAPASQPSASGLHGEGLGSGAPIVGGSLQPFPGGGISPPPGAHIMEPTPSGVPNFLALNPAPSSSFPPGTTGGVPVPQQPAAPSQPTPAGSPPTGPAPSSQPYAALDTLPSTDSDKWAKLAGGDPQQTTALQRPAAAIDALVKSDATDVQKQAAHQYIDNNPTFKNALVNAGVLDDKGNVDAKKGVAMMADMKKHVEDASSYLDDYTKNNPNATQSAVSNVAQLALVKANIPILANASSDTAGQRVGSYGSEEFKANSLAALAKDPDMAPALTQAVQSWSQDQSFAEIDRSGDKSGNTDDGIVDEGNINNFINNAPES